MTHREESAQRATAQRRVVGRWATTHGIELERFDEGQRWVLFAALNVLAFVGALAPLRRIVGYVVAHMGMDLGSQALGALVGVTDRAVRLTQAQAPAELLHAVRHPAGGPRSPALAPHHAGPLAKFFVAHPTARVAEILAFVRDTFGVTIERHTLHHFVTRYGLGCLQGDRLDAPPPFWAERPAAAPSS